MARTHLATHIVADVPSPRSGVTYSAECLDNLITSTAEVPVFFGRLEESGFIATQKTPAAKLVGFDVINETLYVIIESDEDVIERLLADDYIVRFLSHSDDDKPNPKFIEKLDIRAVLLEKEDAEG